MKIIHAINPLPRLVCSALSEQLAVIPADVAMGARQTGNSTLAEQLVGGERSYCTLDDFEVLDAARRDPEALPDFRRLMLAACLRLGQLLNQTEQGRDVALPQPTVHRWLNLLETSYQFVRLPVAAPWGRVL